jgi:hypothetical protein
MEEQQKIDPRYISGFEHGYWLQKGNSKDIDAITQRAGTQPEYQSGMKAGRKEAQREKVRERLQRNTGQSADPEAGIDMD